MAIEHKINPVAVTLFDTPLTWYWLFYPVGFFLVFFLAEHFRRHTSLTRGALIDHAIISWLSIIIGGRLGYVFVYNWEYFRQYPDQIYQFWNGGMSFHGALIFAALANWLWVYRRPKQFLMFADLACMNAPIALLLGRMGNFINGELWGRPTDVPWAVVFPLADDIPRHPSQLYEAFAEGLLTYVILYLNRHHLRTPGLMSGYFLICYASARFVVEFFREADRQLGYFAYLSVGQWLCLAMLLSGLVWVYRTKRTNFGHLR